MSQNWSQEQDTETDSGFSVVPWVCGSLGVLAVVWAVFFFVFSGGGQEDDEKYRRELFSLLDESKTIFNPTDRDRMLSDVIDESMSKEYYDIAREAASFISMPMIRRGMYKRIAEHCMRTSGAQSAKDCIVK